MLALIGPSGCGKTTLLRSLNRLVDLTPAATRGGRILLDGEDVDRFDVTHLRRRVGMLFQQPNPFPMSIFDNVAYGLRERGSKRPVASASWSRWWSRRCSAPASARRSRTTSTTRRWRSPAASSSGSASPARWRSSPRSCCSTSPARRSTRSRPQMIEETIVALRSEVAIVIVTHNLQQAQRVADHVAFMYLGDLVEYGEAEQVFGSPVAERTREYVSGGFG